MFTGCELNAAGAVLIHQTEKDVAKILVASGRACGIRLIGGEVITARRTIICNVTPTQLYGRLLADAVVPPGVLRAARQFRYGRADMQIHLALSQRPQWSGDERLVRTPIVHVTSGLDGVSRAVNEAERGLLPAEATIVCGQPIAIDPSRAPDGRWILWLQLQELPARVKGDARDEIAVGDGSWTTDLRERYADRILARLEHQILNLRSSLMRRVVLSPADLERANINLVGGDPYSGSCQIDQFFLWRPLAGYPSHRTPIANLYHIGASTHPGPGLGAASGTIVARMLLREAWPQRVIQMLPRKRAASRPAQPSHDM